jgi:hypothetical protein
VSGFYIGEKTKPANKTKMGDTCVPYFFELTIYSSEPGEYSAYDYDYNDKLSVRCYYNYNKKGQQLYYHIFYDNEHIEECFDNIKETLEYCQKQKDTNYIFIFE